MIDFITFEKDLQIGVKVDNERVKKIFEEKITHLNELLKGLKYRIKPVTVSINQNKNRGNSLLVPKNSFPKSLKRIEGII